MVLPTDWLALLPVVFLLGMRHGFDLDHLAAIDSLTRLNLNANPSVSRWAGFLFALGHGLIVILVALLTAFLAKDIHPPRWLESTGAWISIVSLFALGSLNLAAVLGAQPGRVVQPKGLKARWISNLGTATRPWQIILIGALFALSFDTFTLAVLFSLTALSIAGAYFAAALGIIFMLGMMLTDSVNGLWVARLLQRADALAARVSRVIAIGIGTLSLSLAMVGLARLY